MIKPIDNAWWQSRWQHQMTILIAT
jgi:hypothetical protein